MLALTIANAHILGLHQESFYDKLPIFESELSRRLWWQLYNFDRRVSLETGRPLVIQDSNISTKPPSNLSDGWLSRHKFSKDSAEQLSHSILEETSRINDSCVPYLTAMVTYSQIVGKFWSGFYGTPPTATSAMPYLLCDYLDVSIENAVKELPECLIYRPDIPFDEQFAEFQWWQIKHSLLIHLVSRRNPP